MRALGLALALAAAPAAPHGPTPSAAPLPRVDYGYDLAMPDGVVSVLWPSLAYDRAHSELFVVAEGFVRIFDASGMEVHRFGDDGSLGQVMRAVVLDDGQIVVLTNLDGKRAYLRCDFRGEMIVRFGLTGVPDGFADFQPDQMVVRNDRLYFAERGSMRVVVTDTSGVYRQSFQLGDFVAAALPRDGERTTPGFFDAFNVDSKGNLLFTMSTLFAAAVASPSGEVRLFGKRGSRPGSFNIVGGIDADENGNFFVTDRLRSVVSVWSPDLRHLATFGYRGDGPMNLIAPYEIAVGNGKVFVAQGGRRGVKVFHVSFVAPEAVFPTAPARAD